MSTLDHYTRSPNFHYLEYLVTCVRDIFHDIYYAKSGSYFLLYDESKGSKLSSFNGYVDTLKKHSCRNLQQKRQEILIDFLTFSADLYNPRYFTLKSYLLSAGSILSSKNHQKHLMIKKLERPTTKLINSDVIKFVSIRNKQSL